MQHAPRRLQQAPCNRSLHLEVWDLALHDCVPVARARVAAVPAECCGGLGLAGVCLGTVQTQGEPCARACMHAHAPCACSMHPPHARILCVHARVNSNLKWALTLHHDCIRVPNTTAHSEGLLCQAGRAISKALQCGANRIDVAHGQSSHTGRLLMRREASLVGDTTARHARWPCGADPKAGVHRAQPAICGLRAKSDAESQGHTQVCERVCV